MRGLITALALCCAVAASGQIYIDSYRFGQVVTADLLLDSFPSAAVAYSLRKLDKDYSGSVVTVRRASNNDTLAVGFSGDYLDTTSLKNFCSGTNCFVLRWFDQSGNNRHVAMTTDANQPQIISSGNLVLKDGVPSLDFDGSNDYLTFGSNFLSSSSAGSMFITASFDNTTKASRDILGGLSDSTGVRFDFLLLRQSLTSASPDAIDFYIEGNYASAASTITNTNEHLFAAIYSNNVRRQHYVDNVLFLNSATIGLGNLDDGTQFDIGTEINLSAYLDGKMKEFIIWPTDQDSNRAAIQTNINNFYTIY